MMTAIVQIFQAATGALNAAQVYQELDNQLRLLDGTIRSDLAGVTCKVTPPNNPLNNPGYFEYGENEFADNQGEDADDYIRFTAKAPAGRPFTGRMWVPPPDSAYLTQRRQLRSSPVPADHDHQRICRDHLLPAQWQSLPPRPARGPAVAVGHGANDDNTVTIVYGNRSTTLSHDLSIHWGSMEQPVSWQGMNDISAIRRRPATRLLLAPPTNNSVVLNTLANLTNRENRWAYQRFANDYQNLTEPTPRTTLADDFNGDNVPDYYPRSMAALCQGSPI